jgi:hypothetical protein
MFKILEPEAIVSFALDLDRPFLSFFDRMFYFISMNYI